MKFELPIFLRQLCCFLAGLGLPSCLLFAAQQAPNIPYNCDLVLQQTVRLNNQVQAESYLFKKTEWLLKSVPQSFLLSSQMDKEARQLTEPERIKVMDKFEDHTQIWTVSLQKYPQANADLKSLLHPTEQSNRYHRELAYLGHDQTQAWYAYMPIYQWTELQRTLKLAGGDDPLEAAARGLAVNDLGTMTRNSVGSIFYEAGPKAVPYLEKLLHTTDAVAALNVLATIQTKEATQLMIKTATESNQEQAKSARNLLQFYPRPDANEIYFQWLDDQAGKEPLDQLLQVCSNLDAKRTTKFLPRILENPKSLREYRLTFELTRTASGQGIPKRLLELEQEIKTFGYASSTNYDQAKVDDAVAEVLRSSDPEAAAVIGLSLAAATTKGDWRPANHAGVSILKGIKNGEKTGRRIAESVGDPWLKEKLKAPAR
jgi:hypothetical protein